MKVETKLIVSSHGMTINEGTVETVRKRDPIQARGIKSKERLIAATRELISRDGFDNVTAYKICQTAGTSIGTFYAYFEDKKEIFYAIIDAFIAETYETIGDDVDKIISRNLQLEPALMELISHFYDRHKVEKRLHEEILIQSYKDPLIQKQLSDNDARLIALLQRVIDHYSAPEKLARADVNLIYNTIKVNIHSLIFENQDISAEQWFCSLCRMVYLFIQG